MKKITRILFFAFLILTTELVFAQEDSGVSEPAMQKSSNDPDIKIKEELYKKYKKEVQSYDKNDFDALFFEFFKKQKDAGTTLTQEEFYTYTIKIAIYSEKLGLLYKDQKKEADRTKQEWFDRSYSDYLNSKK